MRPSWGSRRSAMFISAMIFKAADAAARFAGEQAGMTYSRLQNPTVEMLEERIALMEGAEACRVQASGMAAMTAALLCQLQTGDHVVAGRAAFGSCRWLTDTLLPKFGIATTIIDARDNDAWVDAIRPETKVFFFETPANPTMDVVDLRFVCGLAKERGITSVVDNAFATAALQRPMEFGADVVAYSATKMMDGQGRVLAGAVCGSKAFIDDVLLPFQRNTGPNLSPFNAWVVLKGLETLDLRIRRQSENALKVGRFIEGRVPKILFPGLAKPSAAQSGDEPDGHGRLHLRIPCRWWTDAGACDPRCARAGRYQQQHRRFAQPDDAPRIDDAQRAQRGCPPANGHRRRHVADQHRP